MDFVEIAVTGIDGEAAEAVSELFNRYGYGGAVIETFAPHFDKVTVRTVMPAEDDHRLCHLEAMLALIGQALPHGLPEPQRQFVNRSDWANFWREHFHVVRVGRHFVIKPSWRDYTPTPDDVVIEIDPGLAFGSGLHPTTRLCLDIFEDMPWAGQSLFDVGTGSGILSIAACKLGAGQVRAVDVDEVAVRVARENLVRNGYPADSPPQPGADGTLIETAVGFGGGKRRADSGRGVVANILAHILIQIMADLSAALDPGGQLILSGIIAEQEAGVTAAAAAHPPAAGRSPGWRRIGWRWFLKGRLTLGPTGFFIPPDWIAPPAVNLRGDTARQIRTVLRLRPGEEIVVLDNLGAAWRVTLTEVGREVVRGQLVDRLPVLGEPALNLWLYQGTLKAQKFEWVLQKGHRVGDHPLCADHLPAVGGQQYGRVGQETGPAGCGSFKKPPSKADAACCPRLEPALPLAEAFQQAGSTPLGVMLWEEATGLTLKQVLAGTTPNTIALFVGPEGGIYPGRGCPGPPVRAATG